MNYEVVGLDDKLHIMRLNYSTTKSNSSKLHKRARNLLKQVFPFDTPYEEVILPGTGQFCMGKNLSLDFLILRTLTAIEVHGEQHYKYNSHFYASRMDFVRALGRDRKKAEWLAKNAITLIELPYNESDEEWLTRLKK